MPTVYTPCNVGKLCVSVCIPPYAMVYTKLYEMQPNNVDAIYTSSIRHGSTGDLICEIDLGHKLIS